MGRLGGAAAAVLAAAIGTALPARADWRDHGRFHDHDIRHFERHDFDTWRGGHWNHGWHDGRFGWWWNVGPSWYDYPYPVYPYPQPYVPPAVIVQQPPIPAPPPTQFWYYCDNPAGYYPYVQSCPTPWRPVPAQPSP